MSVKDSIKKLRTDLATMIAEAKTLHEANLQKAAADTLTQEDANRLATLIEAGKAKRTELDNLLALDANDDFLNSAADAPKAQQPGGRAEAKTWGARIVDDPAYKAATAHGNLHPKDFPRIEVGNFKDWIGREGRQRKAIYTSLDSAGGYVTVPARDPEILDIARQTPPSVIDLVNRTTTNSDLVEYLLMATRTDSAAQVSERTATNGTPGDDVFGLKPESSATIDLKNAAVKTIAAWIGISRQAINDARQLRDMVDTELMYEVEHKLEADLITDILAWSGIQTRVHATSGARFDATDNIADTLRRAVTDIILEMYSATGIVLNPAQGETLELLKDDNNQYLRIYDGATMRVFRVPVLETPSMTAGSALVANWKMGVKLWDREQTSIQTGQPNDYFLRNAYAILAELRAAWAVVRPKAVEKITNLP